MWGKVALALSAVALVAAAGAGYVAVVGIDVDATKDNLVGHWTGDKGTALVLNSDGTFTADALDRCFGPIHPMVRGLVEMGSPVTSGTGRWRLDTGLELAFESPRQLAVHVQVGQVNWAFRPTAVTLSRSWSDSDDVHHGRCTFVPE
jgi:hypothetical protein